MKEESNGLSRRDLFRAASAGALVAGVGGAAEADQSHKLENRNKVHDIPRRRLGRTNMNVSVIGAGCASIQTAEILHQAIDKGVNYIDTAAVYPGSEPMVGQVLKERRGDVFVCTKIYPPSTWSADRILQAIDASLKRLQTDFVDLLLVHSVDIGKDLHGYSFNVAPNSPFDGYKRMDNPGLKEAIDIARKNGKARYFGVSSHNESRLQLGKHAIDTGLFDAMLIAYNYANFEQAGIGELLEYAKKHDVGVIGMKTGQGEIRVPGVEALPSQIAWALSKGCATVINSNVVKNEEAQNLALSAAKVKLSQRDYDILEKYTQATSKEYCRGCAHICQSACPADVRIADIMRFDMYHRHYGGGYQEHAKLEYAGLQAHERILEQCATCRKCEEACIYDLPIVDKLRYVDSVLT